MNKFIPFLFLLSFFVACNQAAEYADDLEGMKLELKDKKGELKTLETRISELEEEIEKIEPSKEKKRRLITTQMLEKKDFEHFVDIQAFVEAGETKGASSAMGGRILSMPVVEGNYIRKGDLIATVDVESLQKQIAEVETSLVLAKDVYTRQSRLWEQKIGSEIQYLQAKNNKEQLEKRLETIRSQMGKANIYAPMSGVIDRVLVKGGEMASPGMPVVQILNVSSVKVVADVPEIYLGKIKKGQMVSIEFPNLENEIRARVSMIGRSIDPANRTFKVEANLNNSKGNLKPNLLATMKLKDMSEKDAIVIPTEMILQDVSGKNYVFIKANGEEGDYAKMAFVEVGQSSENETLVLEGLDGTEELIIKGARDVSEGELVKVLKTTKADTDEKEAEPKNL